MSQKDDLISRQVAIDEIRKCRFVVDAIEKIRRLPSAEPEIIWCEDCRWGREVCGNIECFVDGNIPPEYHGYGWSCPNGEKRNDE